MFAELAVGVLDGVTRQAIPAAFAADSPAELPAGLVELPAGLPAGFAGLPAGLTAGLGGNSRAAGRVNSRARGLTAGLPAGLTAGLRG